MTAPRVSRLTESDWRVFATLRLHALTDTFGPDDPQHRQETGFTAAQWRRRLRAHAQFGMFLQDRAVGLVGAQRDRSASVYLYSLWLEPTARGRGLGRVLVQAAVDWARSEGARVVTLRVHHANSAARTVYEGLGFRVVTTGHDGRAGELTMSLSVG